MAGTETAKRGDAARNNIEKAANFKTFFTILHPPELQDHQKYCKKKCHENRHPYLDACSHG
jgi:hypothetical protein